MKNYKIEYSTKGFWEITKDKKQFWPACNYPETNKQFIKIDAINFWVETEGKGSPLILLHGGPAGNHCYFHPGTSLLGENNFLIYYDMRGLYMSSEAEDENDYGLLQDAKDVESLRKALNLGKINILGHSYGGIVAFMYAFMYQDNLNHIVFCSTPIAWTDEDADRLLETNPIQQELNRLDPEENKERAKELIYKLYHPKPISQESKYYSELFSQSFNSLKSTKIMNVYDKDKTEPDWEKLSSISKPMLFLWGNYDPIERWDKAEKIISKLPNAEIFIFEESGHDPFTDEPHKFAEVINKFLSTK